MNKLLCIAAIITPILIFCCAFSRIRGQAAANELVYWKETGANTRVRIVTIEGHDYIMLHGSDNCSIMHAASCKCQKDLHN